MVTQGGGRRRGGLPPRRGRHCSPHPGRAKQLAGSSSAVCCSGDVHSHAVDGRDGDDGRVGLAAALGVRGGEGEALQGKGERQGGRWDVWRRGERGV